MKSIQVKRVLVTVCALGLLIMTDSACSTSGANETAGTALPTDNKMSRVKILAFNDVNKLRLNLSTNGIGALHDWKNPDGYQWMSITSYYEFGGERNGIKNSLAYYLTSENADHVQELRLVLDVSNKSESKAAFQKYASTGKATFRALNTKEPAGLIAALQAGKAYQFSDSRMKIVNEVRRNKIDSYRLIITAK